VRQHLIQVAVAGLMLATLPAQAQSVPCWYVPNGSNNTIQCANGFWRTVTPDGEEFTGNGMTDPSASAQGSGIVINPGTGGPNVGAGPTVTAPTQTLPMLEPYQSQQYGFQPRQD
jgi:type 1 fimbria pilin